MSEPLYYIQNKGYAGDCLLWWRGNGNGYTTNLDAAWKVPADRAAEICRSRPKEDIPWLASEIDAAAHRHVNSEAKAFRDLKPAKLQVTA